MGTLRNSLRTGLFYFLAVFSVGFLLGVARVLWVAPRLGELRAVLLELPWMLGTSWLVCRWLARRLKRAGRPFDPWVWGGFALFLLITAEGSMAVYLFGKSPGDFLQSFSTAPGKAGGVGQLLFALIPAIFARRDREFR